ncbi:hypothetical protein E4U54_004605 [Claviceps lovelessii]|nr:hypothetical protein E4U54_004605 [Claviceps lovelessii]
MAVFDRGRGGPKPIFSLPAANAHKFLSMPFLKHSAYHLLFVSYFVPGAVSSIDQHPRQRTHNMMHISSAGEFDRLLYQQPRLVASFTSSYCKPCGFITPKFAELEREYGASILFVVVDLDVEANQALAKRYAVGGLPTFMMFRRREKVDECSGLDEGALEGMVKTLAGG